MKRTAVFKFLTGFTLAAFILSSCTTDVNWDNLKDNFKIDQSLVLPLGEAQITIEDILNQLDSTDFIGTEGEDIFVQYTDSVEWSLRDYTMPINTIPIEKAINPSPGGIIPVPGNSTIPIPAFMEVLDLGLNSNPLDQRIDYVKLRSGKLKITLNKSNLDIDPANVKATLTFPDGAVVFENGTTSIVHTPTAFGVEEEILLPAFTMFTYNNSTGIKINVDLEIKTGVLPIIATPASEVNFKLDMSDFDLKVAYGFFKPTVSDAAQVETADLGDYQADLPEGLFRLAEPVVKLTVKNNIGVKLGVNLEFIKAYKKNDASFDPIYAQFKNNSHSTKIIVNPAPEYGQVAMTYFTLDKDSGQIDRLFDASPYPDMIDYKYTLTNEPREGLDFMIPGAKLKLQFDVKVPLSLKSGSYVELKDTISDLKIDSLLSKDYVEKAILVLKVTNGIPVGADFKIKLLNEAGNKVNATIDSVFTLTAAPVDNNGLVISNQLTAQEIKIEVLKNQLSELRSAKSIAFTLRVDRKDNKPMRLEKSNKITIKAGIFVKGDFDLNSEND